MPVLKIKVSEKEMKSINAIWKINKKLLKSDFLQRIGWLTKEDFLSDILRFGLDKASEDPVGFIKNVRDEKDPIFKQNMRPLDEKIEEEFKKAYA